MRTFSATAVVEPPPTSNRRQSLRQIRTNPTRSATNANQARGAAGAPQPDPHNANTGFFPAITHFTDSIAAVPKEMIRNYTMLKEVDAKIYGPEELLGQLVKDLLAAPIPPRKPTSLPQINEATKLSSKVVLDALAQENGNPNHTRSREPAPPQAATPKTDLPRRQMSLNLRMVMNEMLGTLDEKNHVISTAVDELSKQLARCDTSFSHIPNEISEEARYGSLNHWAYTEKAAEKKGTLAGERTRRDAAGNSHPANTGPVHDVDGVASRSELRREALAARKRPNPTLDSDFDEGRSPAQTAIRKAQANGKGRKAAEPPVAVNGTGVGLGIANGVPAAPPPSKRRKVEKQVVATPLGGLPMERAMSSVYGSNIGSARGTAGSPRETPAVEAPKKRGRATGGANGNVRRRANTNISPANSPLIASSPVTGTFAVTKELPRKSPAPATNQRAQPSRGRQNSTQSMIQEARNRPSSSTSTSNKAPNGNGTYATTADPEKVSGSGRSVVDSKATVKEALNGKGEHSVEEISTHDGAGDPRGAIAVGGNNKSTERALKREDTENGSAKLRPDRPPSISVSTRGGGKLSKTTTPLNTSFSEPPPRSRPTRVTEPPVKRSHKKGAGLAAQLAAAAAAANNNDEEISSIHGDEDEEDDDSEPRYCYCNQVSYGEMVACDMETCAREWFHLDCVGLAKAPTKNAKWFCDECKELLKKGKISASASTTTSSTTAGR